MYRIAIVARSYPNTLTHLRPVRSLVSVHFTNRGLTRYPVPTTRLRTPKTRANNCTQIGNSDSLCGRHHR
jgi:hypothetical protein